MSRISDRGIAENFFRRDGRLNRWRYFKRTFVVGIIETLIMSVIFFATANALGEVSPAGDKLTKVVDIIGLIPLFFLSVRRLHDMNKGETLAYVLIVLNVLLVLMSDANTLDMSFEETVIAIPCMIIGLYILFSPGTKGSNRYGDDPLA